jgi:quercetin dioxygenase-like cupin family protein
MKCDKCCCDDHCGDLIGRSVGLGSLLRYQKGAIVSRTIIDKKAGTVTLFAFDKGQSLSEHTAPYDAMVCVLDGAVDILLSGKPHRVKKGSMLVMPARVPHALKAVQRFKMLLIMVRS